MVTMKTLNNKNGFSLIELTMVIIIIGIMTSIAMQSMNAVIDDVRESKTKQEMEMLSDAIVGNPDITADGKRSDFGYVGDIGAFPPNLQALYTNPGYANWNGPYIELGISEDSDGYSIDEWGQSYTYIVGSMIRSTGSGTNIDKKIADAQSDYLLNHFDGNIKDLNDSIPGATYKDSVNISIKIPNGAGTDITKIYHPDSSGDFTLDTLPAGLHELRIIYTPDVDTIFRYLTILPRHKSSKDFSFASAYFGSGGGSSSSSEILRPNGAGSLSQLTSSGCSNNWECVDEETSDDDASYVEGSGSSWNDDLYSVENSSVSSGTIDSLIIYMNCWGSNSARKAETILRTNNNNYNGSSNNLSSSYTTYTTLYITNPNTSSPWTWTEIDNLEIGQSIKQNGRCTQVWVEVFYTN